MIRVQREGIDLALEIERLGAGRGEVGCVASFVGLVRGAEDGVHALTLEHYAGMTERELAAIETEARGRWPVIDVTIVHRYGRLLPGERIVFVAVAAAHRAEAFAACEFLVDWLKTKAPFWKLEDRSGGAQWVEARAEDSVKADRWGRSP